MEKETECYVPEKSQEMQENEKEEEELNNNFDEYMLNSLLNISGNVDSDMNNMMIENNNENDMEEISNSLMINLESFQNKGRHFCGYSGLCETKMNDENVVGFIEIATPEENSRKRKYKNDNNSNNNFERPSKRTIAGVLKLKITDRRLLFLENTENEQNNNSNNNLENMNNENITNSEFVNLNENGNKLIANGTALSIVKWSKKETKVGNRIERFDDNQREAFIILCSTFVLTFINTASESSETERSDNSILRAETYKLKNLSGNHEELRMFLDGPGGSGKSKIINEVLHYCKCFCSLINVPFTKNTILVTASTGVAATHINGQTLHSACYLGTKETTEDQIRQFSNVRLIIVDEISMISKQTLTTLNNKLKNLRNRQKYYGGLNIVFIGDFRQLKPVGCSNSTIYSDRNFLEWYTAINTYIELKGRYRFFLDKQWGDILDRFHKGKPSIRDFEIINKKVIMNNSNTLQNNNVIPNNIRYCTKVNKDRDAIHTGLFIKLLNDRQTSHNCIIVLADNLEIATDSDKKNNFKKIKNISQFYSECGEDDIKFNDRNTSRMDPVLKLYYNCSIMLTNNMDVEKGMANGTEAHLKKIILKPNEKLFEIKMKNTLYNPKNNNNNEYIMCKAIFASQIKEVQLESPVNQNKLVLNPISFTFNIKLNLKSDIYSKMNLNFNRKMKAIQLPFVSNSATTCHKLQGATCENLCINSFDYSSNWPYVALSRVKTLNGLFLKEPISYKKDFTIESELVYMKKEFYISKRIPDNYLDNIEKSLHIS